MGGPVLIQRQPGTGLDQEPEQRGGQRQEHPLSQACAAQRVGGDGQREQAVRAEPEHRQRAARLGLADVGGGQPVDDRVHHQRRDRRPGGAHEGQEERAGW